MDETSEARPKKTHRNHHRHPSFSRGHLNPPYRQKKKVDERTSRVQVWPNPLRYSVQAISEVQHESCVTPLHLSLFNRELLTVKARNSQQGAESAWALRSRTIIDEETRAFKITLNKLAPTNYEKLKVEMTKMLKPDLLQNLAELIFERASLETKFLPLYAQLCKDLSLASLGFKRSLLETCQSFYEAMIKPDNKQPVDRKKLLGCLRFIGQLNQIRLLPVKIIIQCLEELLSGGEDCIEGACHLISTCSELTSSSRFESQVRTWIELLKLRSADLSSRIKFLVLDLQEARQLKLHALENAEAPVVVKR